MSKIVMYDDTSVPLIPADATAIAFYVDGRFANGTAIRARFPKAHLLGIAVTARDDAECLDIEPGDATPAQVPDWVKRQQKRGIPRPVVYSSLANARTVLDALAHAGIPRTAVRVWTAHYTHIPHICSPRCGFGLMTNADATQWTDKSHGRSLDESLCRDDFFPPLISPAERRRRKVLAAKKRVWRAHRVLAVAALHTVGKLNGSIATALRAYIAQLDQQLNQK